MLLFLRGSEIERRVEAIFSIFPAGKDTGIELLPWLNQNMLSRIPHAENRSVCQGGLPDIQDETPRLFLSPFCKPKARESLSRKMVRKRLTG